MTDRLINILLLKLKILGAVCLLALVLLMTFSFRSSQQTASDFWQQLGISKTQGVENVRHSFINGYLNHYGAKNAKNIAAGNRAAVAKDLMIFAKEYISSPQFKKEYDNDRMRVRPSEPQKKVIDKEAIRKKLIADTEKSIKSSEDIAKQFPDMAKGMQSNLDLFRTNLKDYKEPNSKMVEMMYNGEIQSQQHDMEYYKTRVAKWEKDYPAEPKVRIKQRLQHFLKVGATVDFNAELKQAGNKKKFVDPKYEGKATDWKTIYRAGKEVYDVTRPFVEAWVSELAAF